MVSQASMVSSERARDIVDISNVSKETQAGSIRLQKSAEHLSALQNNFLFFSKKFSDKALIQ